MSEVFEAKGVTATVYVHPNKVVLKYKKFLGAGSGEKEIRIKNISSIQLRKPGLATNGYLQFIFSGSSEQTGRNIFKAANDENTVMFAKKNYEDFLKVKELIEKRMDESDSPSPSNSSSISIADELKKLAELKEVGILSDEEFNEQKKKLLS